MSPGNRGPKDGLFGRTARPSQSNPKADPRRDEAPEPTAGPSTLTGPPERRAVSRRVGRAKSSESNAHAEGPAGRSRASKTARQAKAPARGPSAINAEDAWADYEEDVNDWMLTDEHSIAGLKAEPRLTEDPQGRSTSSVPVAPSSAAAPFDPQKHAVPRGPSYDPAVDVGSWEGISGQDQQSRWPITATMLAGGRIRLGRGIDNDVVLAEPSISRAHAELRRSGQLWEIVDLQSGNGTFVGGRRVSHSSFVPGDTLRLGSGTYRLMLPNSMLRAPGAQALAPAAVPRGEVPPKAVLGAPLRGLAPGGQAPRFNTTGLLPQAVQQGPSWLHYAFLSVVLIVGISAAWGGWHMLRVWDIVGPLHTAMFEHYLDGVEALNAHKWAEAEKAFEAVMLADPNSTRGKRYLAAAVAGRHDETKLAQAQTALAARDYASAYRLAQALEASLFHDTARVMLQQITNHVTDQVLEAQTALEAGETAKAQIVLGEAWAIMPGRPDVALLKTRADSTLGLAGGSTPPPTGPVVQVVPRRAARRRAQASGPPASSALSAAISDFTDGNADEALAKLDAMDAPDARAMGQSVRTFLRAYNQGMAEHRNKRVFAAVQALNQAKILEVKISGGQGKLALVIDTKLADMYYVIGMQAYASGQFGEAHAAFFEALGHVPEHALSQSKLDELDHKAGGLVDQATDVRGQDTEKAKSLLHDALQMVAPDGPTAKRAQAALQGLP